MVDRDEDIRTTGLEIAVIGMAGRFPGAGNIPEFWENLKNGVESIAFFTDEELVEDGVNPGDLGEAGYIKARGFLAAPGYFDASFFGYSPAEAVVMDPQLRFLYECAWEALEDAGCEPDTYGGSIGVYIGASDNLTWRARVIASGSEFIDSTLSNKDFIAAWLSYRLNLTGPSTTLYSACSTSLAAIHRACRELLGGECDVALAGGASITVPQKQGYFYREGMIESPDGHCRAFDVGAGGTVFGSGAGVVVLKRLQDAIDQGNHIYAVVRGSAVNNDGNRKVGFTAPSVEGLSEVITSALQAAEVGPESIGYIETHGTGTALGDSIEIKAMVRALAGNSHNRCMIGSVKTNIGHLDAASGAAGFIKTVLCLKHRLVPPTLHFKAPNPELGLEKTPFYVNTRLIPWARQDNRPLRAGVSAFGIGGTNAHLVLEEAPVMGENITGKERDYQLILLSARTALALDRMSRNLAGYLKTHPDIKLADAAYTLQVGRKGFVHRKALVCSGVDEAIEALTAPASPGVQCMVSTTEYRHIVFMFSGQGDRDDLPGMEPYREEPVFRKEMDRCFDILKLFAPSVGNAPFSRGDCPVFVFQYALAKLLMSWGIAPDAVIGRGVGQYTAACLDGELSLEDALAAVVKGETFKESQRFSKDIRGLLEEKQSIFIEIGPGEELAREVEQCMETGMTGSSGQPVIRLMPPDRAGAAEMRHLLRQIGLLWLYRQKIDWQVFHSGCKRYLVSLPSYPFERKRYWIDAGPRKSPESPRQQMAPELSTTAPLHSRPHLDTPYAPPENEIQRHLSLIWQEFFGLEQVGMDDDFFKLGGDSLKAAVLLSRVHKKLHARVSLTEIFKNSTIRGLAQYIREAERSEYMAVEPVEKRSYYVLSPAQRRMYILNQLEPDGIMYNISQVTPLEGEVDREKLAYTIRQLITRHESLRTSFHTAAGEPVQRIHDEVEFAIEYLAAKNAKNREEIIKNFIIPFDLSKAPLLRVGLIRLNDGMHLLLVDMHHIISDGVSMQLLEKDFTALYGGEKLPPLRIQYKDYAHWLQKEIQQEAIKQQEGYWLKEFVGHIPPLNLPTDFPRPAVQRFEGSTIGFFLSDEETRHLKQLVSAFNITLYMVLVGALNLLLGKLTGSEDIVIGTALAGRGHADLEPVIGMFVNTLALRNQPVSGKSIKIFLKEVREKILKDFDNQDYPFEELVEKVPVERDLSRNPIFDVMFTLQNMVDQPRIAAFKQEASAPRSPETRKWWEDFSPISKFDLTVLGYEGEDRLMFTFEYATALFKQETIRRWTGYFKKVITGMAADPEAPISGIELLSEEEKQRILSDFNRTRTDYPGNKTIHELFAEQADKAPERMAVVGKEKRTGELVQLTYNELHQKSDQLAHLLKEKGVLADSIVGIMIERSIEMIIAISGILKAGGAYLPVDPGYPQERIDYMLKDSGAKLLVTTDNLEAPDFPLLPAAGYRQPATSLAYIIYTSGTTGKAKGTLTAHFNVLRVVKNTNYIDITPNDRVLQLSNYAFDGSVFDIYGALLNGAVLVMVDEDEVFWLERLSGLIKRQGITVFFITTALFNKLVEMEIGCLKNVRKVLFGGEKVSVEYAQKALEYLGKGRIIHVYGPTETTVYATYYFIDEIAENAASIPIGKPISNTTVYILDKNNMAVPIGVVGELFIGGDGTARGYLNNPELTAEKFIEYRSYRTNRTYSSYRTGDLVRWLADDRANIEFLGRIDNQVKIRGFRVEPGEIETKLLETHLVKEAVVVPVEDDKNLCAYFVPLAAGPGPGKEAAGTSSQALILQLKNELSSCLPRYMVPVYYMPMERLPLTSGGKVDRKALPAPQAVSGEVYAGPRDEIEKKLVDLWGQVLGRISPAVSIGIDDNFFDLGGHSLRAAVIVSRIHNVFDVKVPLAEMFKSPTIRELAQYIRSAVKNRYIGIEPLEKREYYELSYNQKRLWFIAQVEPESPFYNIFESVTLSGKRVEVIIREVLVRLVERHESFRSCFVVIDDEPVQWVKESGAVEIPLKIIDISGLEESEQRRRILQISRQEEVTPYELSSVPLFRAVLVKGYQESHILFFTLHHIITDGWSMEVLKREFLLLYEAYHSGNEQGFDLEPLRLQYRDFTAWQTGQLNDPGFREKCRAYWRQKLGDRVPILKLPGDYENVSADNSLESAGYRFVIAGDMKNRLLRLVKESGVTLFTLLVSALDMVMAKLSGQEVILMGIASAGRENILLHPIVGFFVNTLLFKIQVDNRENFPDFLRRVYRDLMAMLEYQSYPLELVFEELKMAYPQVSLMFNMLNLENSAQDRELEVLEPFHIESVQDSKFDMEIYAAQFKNALEFHCHYRKRLFKKESVEYMMGQYVRVIGGIVRDPTKALDHYLFEKRKKMLRLP
jgi:amino acid adenylation domain-containing protein